MNTISIAILLFTLSTIILWYIEHKRTTIVVHLFLLSITPWFLTLIFGYPSLIPAPKTQLWFSQLFANISNLTSGEFLFFSGDGRPGYGTGDHGVFLLSFLPLLLIGAYVLLIKKEAKYKLPLWWVLTGLIFAIIFGRAPGLPIALWYLPALSITATIGLKHLTNHKILFSLNLLWILYEGLRLYHIILVHKL